MRTATSRPLFLLVTGRIDLGGNQAAYVATPEKAFLDLVYLQEGADKSEYLQELRLQNLVDLDLAALQNMVARARETQAAAGCRLGD